MRASGKLGAVCKKEALQRHSESWSQRSCASWDEGQLQRLMGGSKAVAFREKMWPEGKVKENSAKKSFYGSVLPSHHTFSALAQLMSQEASLYPHLQTQPKDRV